MSYPDAPPRPIPASLCYDFPMRADYNAQLVIPRNMTVREAERLCEFIKAIAASSDNGRGSENG